VSVWALFCRERNSEAKINLNCSEIRIVSSRQHTRSRL